MNHRAGSIIFGFVVGVLAAFVAYQWASKPIEKDVRVAQEEAVLASRAVLEETVGAGPLEIIDPLNPDRVVGKGYVYNVEPGWQVSGFYRRNANDLWHPYLLHLDENHALHFLRLSDSALLNALAEDERIEVLP